MPEQKPNILIIMTDQHSRQFLGCYGNDIVRTPNLDRLAGRGMRFTNSYCPSPVCVPSRMSFMTGRFPVHNQVWNNENLLSSSIPTWAHAMGTAGYETVLIGRMHFEGADQRHGFERRPLTEPWSKHPGAPTKGGPAWTHFPQATSAQCRESVEIAGRGKTHYQWYDEQVTESACSFLNHRTEQGDRPFAAVVGYVLPHCPFIAPKELFDYYYENINLPEIEKRQPQSIRRLRDFRRILDPPLEPERIRVARAAYFGLCEYSDSLIGRVLDALSTAQLDRDTVVVYTSDHGEMAGEHGLWWKSCFYEGSAGVPLLVSFPDSIEPGSVSKAVCNLTDLGATFTDIAGAEPLPFTDGNSLWPILKGEGLDNWSNETYSEIVDLPVEHGKELVVTPHTIPARMVRSGPWKLWFYGDEEKLPPSLFNLEEDPRELSDLGDSALQRQIREELLQKVLHGWDPQSIGRAYHRNAVLYEYLTRWGREIKAEIPDTLPFPSPDVENVELI